MDTRWVDKNILCLGDSLTEAGIWPARLQENLRCNVRTHCKGGLGMKDIVDGGKGPVGELKPLTESLVKDVDLIIFYAGYNDRGLADGGFGDLYSPMEDRANRTIAGTLQYCINRIYEELERADNLGCKVQIVTPHCVGKYQYIEVDGYHEYPEGSGRTVKSLAKTMENVSVENNLPCCNLWEQSGINKHTWKVYGANPGLDEVHCSQAGYELIGDIITGAVIKNFGL